MTTQDVCLLPITHTTAWQALTAHRNTLRGRHLRDFFATEPDRFARMALSLGDLLVDFSKQRIDARGLSLLTELARAADVEGWRAKLFAGETINASEKRANSPPDTISKPLPSAANRPAAVRSSAASRARSVRGTVIFVANAPF